MKQHKELRFNVTGSERKTMVGLIAAHTGFKAEYQYLPTYAYKIGPYTVSKNGTLTWEGSISDSELGTLTTALTEGGYAYEDMSDSTAPQADASAPNTDAADTVTSAPPHTDTTSPHTDPADGNTAKSHTVDTAGENSAHDLTIEFPLEYTSLNNLAKILEAKGNLIRQSLGIGSLPVKTTESTIAFPWFDTLPTPDEIQAYTAFLSALCKMAKDSKRITAKEKNVENPKYAFRCFLLRLGFIGDDFKAYRKILLKNFGGSSAFSSQEAENRFKEQQAAKKAAETVQTETTVEAAGKSAEATSEPNAEATAEATAE